MEIKVNDLISFLGYSSIYEPLDDYLHAHGIKKRPNNNGKHLEESVAIKQQGLHVCFVYSGDLTEKGIIAKSPGTYVFNWLDIYLQKQDGFAPYKGPLPFGLIQQMSQQQVRALLGHPLHVTFNTERRANVDFYHIESLVVAVKYTDMNGSAISMVNPCLPDNWAREQGIAPSV